MSTDPAAVASSRTAPLAIDPATGVEHRRLPADRRALPAACCVLAVGAAAPFVVAGSGTAVLGVLCALTLSGCLLVLALDADGSLAIDGTRITRRTSRSTTSIDMRDLDEVHGEAVRGGRGGEGAVLVLRTADGRSLEVPGQVGFPRASGLSAATAHVVHARLRAAVSAGSVPRVSLQACEVLRLPSSCARGRAVGRDTGSVPRLLVVLALLTAGIAYGLLVGQVHGT